MKVVLFLFGIVLSVVAFIAAAMEMAALVMDPQLSSVPGFGSVLQTVSPDALEFLRTQYAWKGWDLLLSLPGWLIFGVPGLVLIVFARSGNGDVARAEYEHSLFLFDELAAQAQAQDFQTSGDDLAPGYHADMDIADVKYTQDDIVDDIVYEHDFLLPPTRSDANTNRTKE